jgi:hypothetical protein
MQKGTHGLTDFICEKCHKDYPTPHYVKTTPRASEFKVIEDKIGSKD